MIDTLRAALHLNIVRFLAKRGYLHRDAVTGMMQHSWRTGYLHGFSDARGKPLHPQEAEARAHVWRQGGDPSEPIQAEGRVH